MAKGGFSQAMRDLIGDAAEKLDVSTDEARLYPEQQCSKNSVHTDAIISEPPKKVASNISNDSDNSSDIKPLDIPEKKEVALMEETTSISKMPENTFYGSESTEIDSTTTISKGTVINGDITSDGDIELCGTLNGNIKTKGSLRLSGGLVGDASARQMTFLTCEVRGNMTCESEVSVDEASVIYGNVEAESIILNGKIRGSIKVKRDAILQDNAVLLGNLEAGSISIDQGAKLEGEVKIVFDKACKDLFDNKVAVSSAKNSSGDIADSKSVPPKTIFSI